MCVRLWFCSHAQYGKVACSSGTHAAPLKECCWLDSLAKEENVENCHDLNRSRQRPMLSTPESAFVTAVLADFNVSVWSLKIPFAGFLQSLFPVGKQNFLKEWLAVGGGSSNCPKKLLQLLLSMCVCVGADVSAGKPQDLLNW